MAGDVQGVLLRAEIVMEIGRALELAQRKPDAADFYYAEASRQRFRLREHGLLREVYGLEEHEDDARLAVQWVHDADLPASVRNAVLWRAGCISVLDVRCHSEDDWLRIRGIGDKGARLVVAALDEIGATHKASPPRVCPHCNRPMPRGGKRRRLRL